MWKVQNIETKHKIKCLLILQIQKIQNKEIKHKKCDPNPTKAKTRIPLLPKDKDKEKYRHTWLSWKSMCLQFNTSCGQESPMQINVKS